MKSFRMFLFIVLLSTFALTACERSREEVVGDLVPAETSQEETTVEEPTPTQEGEVAASVEQPTETTEEAIVEIEAPTPTPETAPTEQPQPTPEPEATEVAVAEPTPTPEVAASEEGATETPASETAPAGGPRVHIVQEGEWLYAIARQYGVSPDAIIAANNLQPPYSVYPGQELIIPDEAPEEAADEATGERVHIVQEGEWLYAIARQYGVSPDAIIAANNLQPPYFVYPGQELIIPAP
nr:LysM peptidoglycan-binding domain-containing protein [Ardenticatena sp.]